MLSFFAKKINISLVAILIAVPLLLVIGYMSEDYIDASEAVLSERKNDCLSDLKFINPEPGCELFELKLERTSSLQNALELEVSKYIKDEKASRISVFARDLVSKRYVGVNESEIFIMASLLKVPLAVAYYRIAETNPGTLEQLVTYDGKPDLYSMQTVMPKDRLLVNHEYSVNDLLYKSLVYSDNTAAEILSQHITEEYLDKALVAIGLETIQNASKEDFVTAKAYANVFRILYNSSFLVREFSNSLLGTLSNSAYTDGATKLLPKEVVVAHKFGERTILNKDSGASEIRQLHDCGIVYAKNSKEPYTFCIMTEGADFTELQKIIQNLSLTIYNGLVD